VEEKLLKRKICNAEVASANGKDLEESLKNLNLTLGGNGDTNKVKKELNIIDNMIERDFFPEVCAFSYPLCWKRFVIEDEGMEHLLLSLNKSGENMKEKSIDCMHGRFYTDFCLNDG
jgi:hypothetical protein